MQIKRFEAVDMTDALRLVKREFGDDAVILSAKEVRPRGFFSALRKKHVEITAATDDPADNAQGGNDFSGLLAQQLDDTSPTDRVSLSTPAWTKKVIEREKQAFPQPPVALEEQILPAEKNSGLTQQQPTPEAASTMEEIVSPKGRETRSNVDMAAANGLMRDPDTDDLAVQPFYADSEKRKIIAVVGPSGAGKSTALAKLAWHCQVVEYKRIGLISLDRFRMAANCLLETVARIMSLPLTVVHDARGMQTALNDLNDVDFVLIDTPGMGRLDAAMMDTVSTLLRLADPDETHLVVNATLRDDVLASTVEGFSSVNPDRLLPTHLDECGSRETIFELMETVRMAASFYADGIELMDALKETTLDRINAATPQSAPVGARVTAFPGKKAHPMNESAVSSDAIGTARYLANRNSELFHHPTCKSVKRINAENIAAFSSIEQAIDKGFKPCRACCNVSAVKKTVTGSTYQQRVGAM